MIGNWNEIGKIMKDAGIQYGYHNHNFEFAPTAGLVPYYDIFMKEIKVIRKGQEQTVIADRDYIKKAIADPGYEKVKEYNNKDMPRTYFSEKEVDILVDYLIAFSQKGED